jgi:DNA adenine methylase
MIYPCLKWAGGKRQLLPIISKYYSFDTCTKYVEPFVGGGAVLFDILNKYDLEEIYISDINENLINLYIIIKDYPTELIKELKKLDKDYKICDILNKKQHFLNRRQDFNNHKNILKLDKHTRIRNAAYMIFLNKTCFNGLYRVNSKGEFNVPFGNQQNPMICDEENIKALSAKLQKVKIKCGSYDVWKDVIDENTFVFLDPPYRPLNKTSNFNSYAKDSFNDDSQKTLATFIDDIHNVGAKFVLCNSDPHNTDINDDFFDDLYKDYYIHRVPASRMINSNANSRGNINELLITNILAK